MENNRNGDRIWELDFFRGIALIIMIYIHILFDLKEFYNFKVEYDSGINLYIGKLSVTLFIMIAGISCSLSRSNIKRGLKVFGIAMILTVITHLYNVNLGIKFGILHFLGIGMLLYPLLAKLDRYALAVLGTVILTMGFFISDITVPYEFLFPIGLTSSRFASSDYYPLVPWLGLFIYGVLLGKVLYSARKSIFKFKLKQNIIGIMGRKTLPIYIIHQPVIMAVLALVKAIR